MSEPITLIRPRIVMRRDGDLMRLHFQDSETHADLVVVVLDRELAPTLADEFKSVAPVGAESRCFRLDSDTLV